MRRRGRRAAAPSGKRGKGLNLQMLPEKRLPLRSGSRRGRSGRRTPTSKQGRLERKKAAARVSRKDHTRKEEVRNSNYRLDFGAREPRRASVLSAPGERRSRGWRCLLRRRTSLFGSGGCEPHLAQSIPQGELGVRTAGTERRSGIGSVVSHPSDKNRNVARVGHPLLVRGLETGGTVSAPSKRLRPCKLQRDAGFPPLSHTPRGRQAKA